MRVKRRVKISQLRKIFKNKSKDVRIKINSLDGYQPLLKFIESGEKECLLFNHHLEVSIDQRIEVRDKGWFKADLINLGDYLIGENGLEERVFLIEKVGKKEVYNVTVDHPKHRYLCNKISIKNCSDAMNTLGLFKYYASRKQEDNVFFNQPIPLTIDHKCTDVLRNLSRGGAPIDFDYYLYAAKDIEYRIMLLEEETFRYVGRRFDINSPDQVSDLLFNEYNIPVLEGEELNKKGRYSTKEEILDELYEKYPQYKILQYIVTYRKLIGTTRKFYLKAVTNSYVDALLPYTKVQIQYSQTVIPTSRFSSSSNSGKSRVIVKTTKTGNKTYSYYKGSGDCGFNSQGINDPHYILKKAKKIKKINSESGVNILEPYPNTVIERFIKRAVAD